MATTKATNARKSGGRTTPKGTKTAAPAKRAPASKPVLQILTAEALSTVKLPESQVDIPELGGAVRVRAFNGERAVAARHYAGLPDGGVDEDKYEIALIALGMIEPALPTVEGEEHPFSAASDLYYGQLSSVGRRIAMAVMALNAGGRAAQISKV